MGQYVSACPTRMGLISGAKRRQQGITLLIALIALVAMTLAAIAMTRSVDIAALAAGNMATRQSATQAADMGIELAIATLPASVTSPEADRIAPPPTLGVYYARMLANVIPAAGQIDQNIPIPVDASGTQKPLPLGWSLTPCLNLDGTAATTAVVAPFTCPNDGKYYVQYFVDRLCSATATLPITHIAQDCLTDVPKTDSTYKAGSTPFSSAEKVYYRITVRVSGPRNTYSTIQTIVAYG